MKIALVILHADASRGGAERYTLDLAAALSARGHSISILASSFQPEETAGARVLLTAKGRTRTGRYLRFLDSLDEHLRTNPYDRVHAMLPVRQCDLYHPHAGIAADAIAAGHRTKSGATKKALAWIGNRFNSRRRQFAAVETQLLSGEHPPVVLCLSGLIQSVLASYYPHLPADRMASLFNGIDLQRFDPAADRQARQEVRRRYNIADSAIVGLMLAHDFERKGLAQAIEALARIKDDRLVLLVGGKPDPEPYRKLAIAKGVQQNIIFCGPVKTPADFYQTADFFLLPTRFDPCSLVVLEALVMGLPVISTRQNGACEIMQDGIHGWILSSPDDPGALLTAIASMLDSELRLKIAAACRQLRPALSQQTHLDKLEAIYRDIA